MKKIVLFNRKGGSGKTIVSYLLARFLSAGGKRVLLVDLDPQRTLTNHFSRLEGIASDRYLDNCNICGLLRGKASIEEIQVRINDKLSLWPSSYDLWEMQSSFTPKAYMAAMEEADPQFDYCIQDLAPNYSSLAEFALLISEHVIIPTQATAEDLEQAEWSLDRTKNSSRGDCKVIVNRFPANPDHVVRGLLEQYKPLLGEALLEYRFPEMSMIQKYIATGEKITRAQRKADFLNMFTRFVKDVTGEEFELEAF